MRAVIRRGPGNLVVDDIATPEPAAGQVLVKTLCCGICGSDLHAVHAMEAMVELGKRSGEPATIDPARDIVFGHEFCAEILDHGPGAERRLAAGTRVVSMPVVIGPQGFEGVGYSNTYPGGFAEAMVLTEALLLPVPNGLDTTAAAMTEPFAVGEHAVAESDAGPGTVNLVIGCGPVVLAVIAALKARGLGPIIASDYSPARRRIAALFGADEVIDPAQTSPHARWTEWGVPMSRAERSVIAMTGQAGKRAIVFECVGVPGLIQQVFEGAHADRCDRAVPVHQQEPRAEVRARVHAGGIRRDAAPYRGRHDRRAPGNHRGGRAGRRGGCVPRPRRSGNPLQDRGSALSRRSRPGTSGNRETEQT